VAYVIGAGQIGLLSTLILRLRGLEVYTLARRKPPTVNAEVVAGVGAHYVSTQDVSLKELAGKAGKADLIVDATGSSAMAFGAMEVLGHNGVLVWTSITGGRQHIEVPSDQVNLDWVLGNKLLLGSVNANREHFEMGIKDLALGDVTYPGVIQKILTHPVRGLDNYAEMMRLLVDDKAALKVYVEVAE
jgi:threonine dehydrogenase-like Zn-dependent dehydrogenase